MSSWLKSVNNLLETLDGTVETAVEERAAELDDKPGQGKEAVDSILAKRGFTQSDDDDEQDEEINFATELDSPTPIEPKIEQQVMQVEESPSSAELTGGWTPVDDTENTDEQDKKENNNKDSAQPTTEISTIELTNMATNDTPIAPPDSEEPTNDENTRENNEELKSENPPDADASDDIQSQKEPMQEEQEKKTEIESTEINTDATVTAPAQAQDESAQDEKTKQNESKNPEKEEGFKLSTLSKLTVPANSPLRRLKVNASQTKLASPAPTFEKEYKEALLASKEAQKEARQLRRYVVSLNKDLETAEGEIQAQRDELDRAASRLEKDRKRYKDEKDKLTNRHTEEVKALKKQHDQALSDSKARHDEQVEATRKQLQEVEQKRMKEGGDWTKELENTIQREQELIRKMTMFEDEKSTLLAQISSLQAQNDRMEARLDSLSQTADNAMLREREAEDKLDMAMSLHARQLSQRQSREAELERTIADLGAALAAAQKGSSDGSVGGFSNYMEMKNQLQGAQDEVETTKAQLEAEKQRILIMQQELRDMSKERTMEASSARSKQLQYDRQVADMSIQISRLQSNLREAQKGSASEGNRLDGDADKNEQIKELTSDIVRLQEKLGNSTSEVSALKSRLQGALDRANKAEHALANSSSFDIESSPPSGDFDGGMRRRRRRGQEAYGGSIRSAIRLNSIQHENAERIGKAIDAIDRFTVDTGKFLRYNPLARGGFILYLLLLHLWTFAVLFLHTHRLGTVHGNFGTAESLPHGPYNMIQHNQDVTQIRKQLDLAQKMEKHRQPVQNSTGTMVKQIDASNSTSQKAE